MAAWAVQMPLRGAIPAIVLGVLIAGGLVTGLVHAGMEIVGLGCD